MLLDNAFGGRDLAAHQSADLTLFGLQLSWGEAAAKLAEVVNDDTFRSLEGKSKHQMWL